MVLALEHCTLLEVSEVRYSTMIMGWSCEFNFVIDSMAIQQNQQIQHQFCVVLK